MERVTLEKVYRAIGRLEGQARGTNNRLDKINGNLNNHDRRINRVETDADKMKGISAAAGVIGGTIITVLAIIVKTILDK